METSLALIDGSALAIMPVMNIQMAISRRDQITDFIRKIMRDGVDFGVIPGTGDKPALLKPGAEKLTTLFGLSKKFDILERSEDWDGSEHNGEPFFYYIYRCSLYRGDLLIAEADGSCNSHESKYRYRKAERVCPACGQATIIKGRAEYGGGWLCYKAKGGCSAKFFDGDRAIEGQEVGRVFNPDVADQANTILKMAQKRALVAATLLAINGSEYFSTKEMPGRDEDDQTFEGEVIEAERKPVTPQDSGRGWDKFTPSQPKTNDKPYKFPSTASEKFYKAVQQATGDFYSSPQHLLEIIGGWFNFAAEGLWDERLSVAVDHARQTRDGAAEPVIESQTEEIAF